MIGLILGIPGVYAIMRAVAALLVEVKPFDLATTVPVGHAFVISFDVLMVFMTFYWRV